MKHILNSKEAKQFFESAGLKISKKRSCHNSITLKNVVTGQTLEMIAESDIAIAAGIPGIYVDRTIQ